MRGAALAIAVWAALAPIARAESEQVYAIEPPEGWPWLLGTVTGTLGSKAMAWETYDFSIGAMDASVWAGDPWGPVDFHLRGLPPGQPQSDHLVLSVSAGFGDRLQPGPAKGPVTVVIYRGKDQDGARLTSEGQTASLTIDHLEKSPDNVHDGVVTGTISARLCPVAWFGKSCQDFTARFDTRMQFDGEFAFREGKI